MTRIDGYEHHTGAHCGSTSLRNLSDFYGWGYDEPTCFGLASGLGFTYLELPESPHRAFFGRPLWLEAAFFDHLGIDVSDREGQDWPGAWTAIRAEIDRNRPVMVFTDIYYLDYFGTDTHFSPHSLLAVGHEDDGETVVLSDSEFEDRQRLPADRLGAAMASSHVVPLANRHLTVTDPEPSADFETAARRAVAETCRYALDPRASTRPNGDGTHGVEGIRAFGRELPDYVDLPDPSWTVRFAYQNVERRGTGGGAFRRLYANFLGTAGGRLPELPDDAPGRMREIADDWTAVGSTLKAASEADGEEMASLLQEASDAVLDLADREERLFEELRASLRD